MSKVIVCFLGTGAQASGLVQKCLDDPEFTPRIVTRDPESAKAKELAAKGAQVVKADLMEDPIPPAVFATSKEGERIYGVFVVTDFWNSCGLSGEKEIAQGKRIAESIIENAPSDVHIIFSTLPDTRQALGAVGCKPVEGDFTVPHLDSKAIIDGFFPAEQTTFLETAFYYQNFDNFGMCSNGVVTLPVKKVLAMIDVADIGKAAYNIFKDPSLKGKRIAIAGDQLTGEEICTIMSDATGKEFKFNRVDYEAFKGFGFPGAEELGNMFWFWDVSGNYGDPTKTRETVCPDAATFREFCEQNKERVAKMAAS
ncbi:hypothetical protein MPSEU_000011600 [Mayamaea pseudoterrestris]|nr:hypothetical protein MPSEU_000011600 [Mayamaea pseudoterrestris]